MTGMLLRPIRDAIGAARREQGFAVPTALMMLLAVTGIVSAGVMSSVRTQSGTTRDQGTKSALPQAESAVAQALLHFNRIAPNANPCSPVTAAAPDAGGWCAPVSGGFDGGTFAYQVRPASSSVACGPAGATECLEIVATGNYGGVTRRVHAIAHSASGQTVFANATVMGRDWINMNSNAEVRAGSATNGSMTLSSNARQCGVASVGVGRQMVLTSNATYYLNTNCTSQSTTPNQGELNLPSVNQGDVAASNDNSRFFALDPVSGNKDDACWNGKKATGANGSCGARHLSVTSNSAVTLGGARYSFCKLELSSNTSLYIQAGQTVAIYFDSPESCGYSSGTVQMDLSSNSRITSTNGGPANVALMFVGSDSRQTRINLSSNTSVGAACSQNFVVYAPRTDITLNSNSTYCGAVAGKTLQLDSNARIYTDSGAQGFSLADTAAHYSMDRFIECTTTVAGQPATGC